MIACHIDYSSSFLSKAQYLANHVSVTLIPSPAVLLYLPTIDDVSNEIESVTSIVF